MKNFFLRVVEILDAIGFSLIVGSVLYFIIGSVTSVVQGHMLEWTFCGSAHSLMGVEWCGVEGHTGEPWLNQFVHRLMNVTIPWFMMFWGFVIVAICSLLMKLLEFQWRGNKE